MLAGKKKKSGSSTAAKGHAVALRTLALYPATCCKALRPICPASIPTIPSPASSPAHACCTVAEQKMSWSYSAHCSYSAGHSPKAHPAGSPPLHCFSCSPLLIQPNTSSRAAAAKENSANPVCKGARVFPQSLGFLVMQDLHPLGWLFGAQ